GVLSTLYSFPGSHDKTYPYAPLVQSHDGNFYDTTSFDNANNSNVIFKISTSKIMTNFYSFTADDDNATPQTKLVQGNDDNFYGTTTSGGLFETMFKITTNGILTTLHSFTYEDSSGPQTTLMQGQDGNFYGTTTNDGTDGSGT